MAYQSLEIHGFRGFAQPAALNLALPNGRAGSGITVLLGPNNGGKSTIIEAFSALTQPHPPPTFSEGKRNTAAGSRVTIRYTPAEGEIFTLSSVDMSVTSWSTPPPGNPVSVVMVPSRRSFSPYFQRQEPGNTKPWYFSQMGWPTSRRASIDTFPIRLFQMSAHKAEFDSVLARVLDPLPEWGLEQSDTGQHYLKLRFDSDSHNSDGMGDGILSLFFIVDALYDSKPGDTVVIDEPELSLHPALQRKLRALMSEYASSRQIIYATHSPYFVDWDDIGNGSQVIRVHRRNCTTVASPLSPPTVQKLLALRENRNNPHILGTDAREAFFLEDGAILVEGQDDVAAYRAMAKQLGVQIRGTFFGWGVGGASNMGTIAHMLFDLGFERVVGILDNNMSQMRAQLAREFPSYRFFLIPADDVRFKKAQPERKEVHGLLDEKGIVMAEYEDSVLAILQQVNDALSQEQLLTKENQ